MSSFYLILSAIEILTIIGFLGWARGQSWQLRRDQVVLFALAWVVILTAPYWGAGPYSFVQNNDEGEFSYPLFQYLARLHVGGPYAHGVAGGADSLSMMAAGNQSWSLERWLFWALPSWAALGIHKVLAVLTAFSGAYLLARRVANADRGTALALAAFHCLAHRYMLGASLYQGLGLHLGPVDKGW